MKKLHLIFLMMILSITLTTPFSMAHASNYEYKITMNEGDTSISKQFETARNDNPLVIVSNSKESETDVDYTVYALKDGIKHSLCQGRVESGKSAGHRLNTSDPGMYLLEITSPGKCKVQGHILVLETQHRRPPSEGYGCTIL